MADQYVFTKKTDKTLINNGPLIFMLKILKEIITRNDLKTNIKRVFMYNIFGIEMKAAGVVQPCSEILISGEN